MASSSIPEATHAPTGGLSGYQSEGEGSWNVSSKFKNPDSTSGHGQSDERIDRSMVKESDRLERTVQSMGYRANVCMHFPCRMASP